jgi:hypothetical protein
MAIDQAEALALLATAAAVADQLATLLPQLEANAQAVKAALVSTDDAALSAKIDELHEQSQVLTAQLTALRS